MYSRLSAAIAYPLYAGLVLLQYIIYTLHQRVDIFSAYAVCYYNSDDFTKKGSDWHKTLDPVGKRRIIMRVQGLILAQVLNYAQTGSTAPLMLLCGLGLVALGS